MRSDLFQVGSPDLIIDCAAEPSVMAGSDGAADYVLDTNLIGTINVLECCRRTGARLLFLSTSRVYSYEALNLVPFGETESRFTWQPDPALAVAADGVTEAFTTTGGKTLYGASKLCSEQLIKEYELAYGVEAIINRCGVLTGPGQMGKIDQGVVVLWISNHLFQKPLSYIGFGGSGKQVRDILHIADLVDLVKEQLQSFALYAGDIWNVGGGLDNTVSLRELTQLCREYTGVAVPIHSELTQRSGDVRYFSTDSSKVRAVQGWAPKRSCAEIVADCVAWIRSDADRLRAILG